MSLSSSGNRCTRLIPFTKFSRHTTSMLAWRPQTKFFNPEKSSSQTCNVLAWKLLSFSSVSTVSANSTLRTSVWPKAKDTLLVVLKGIALTSKRTLSGVRTVCCDFYSFTIRCTHSELLAGAFQLHCFSKKCQVNFTLETIQWICNQSSNVIDFNIFNALATPLHC